MKSKFVFIDISLFATCQPIVCHVSANCLPRVSQLFATCRPICCRSTEDNNKSIKECKLMGIKKAITFTGHRSKSSIGISSH